MAEIRVNSTGGVKFYDADDSHYAQIKAGTITSDTDVLTLGHDAVVAGTKVDLNGQELILDADADTSITADTDDQIDVRIAGADDFQFTANTFTAQSGSSIVVPDGGLTFGSTAISSTAAELNILDGVTSTTAELNILDGVTATASELNLLDGGTSVGSSITLADGDGVVVNDGGTMKTIPASDFATYAGGSLAYINGSQGTGQTSSVNLSSVFSDTYVAYYCLVSVAATSTSSSYLKVKFIDSSNNVIGSDGDYKYAGYEHTGGSGGAGAAFYHSTDAFLPLHTSAQGNSTNLPADYHFWFGDLTDSGHKPHISWQTSAYFHGYDFGWTSGSGALNSEATPAGLNFTMGGGNLREYNIRIWGRKA
jgi:hypothetical protein